MPISGIRTFLHKHQALRLLLVHAFALLGKPSASGIAGEHGNVVRILICRKQPLLRWIQGNQPRRFSAAPCSRHIVQFPGAPIHMKAV